MYTKSGHAERGFTLVEVLVALVVTAFLVAILLDGSVSAASRQKNLELADRSLSLARSKIDDLRNAPGGPARLDGSEGGLEWTLQEQEIARGRRGAFILVEATVSAGNSDKPNLVTLRKRYLKSLVAR